MRAQLNILGDKVDLFQDENISVIDSVVDIKDITKNNNSFTRNFTVPASRRNNKLFKHWYNANIDNSFDARKKQQADITIDGIQFKEGFVQLMKVNVEDGKATSYSVNFSGRVTGIKKTLGDLKLKDLDLSAYDHDYDSNTVRIGLANTLFNGDLVYTPIVKKQYYVEQGGSESNTDKLQNISYQAASDNGIIWNDLRPSLKLIRIIDAIEEKTGITFTRDFFDTDEFSNLFLWLNNSSDINIKGASKIVDFNRLQGASDMNLSTNIATFPCDQDLNIEFRCRFTLTPKAGFENASYVVKMYLNGEENFSQSVNNGVFINEPIFTFFSPQGQQDQEVYFEITAGQDFEYNASFTQIQYNQSNDIFTAFADDNFIDSNFIVENEVPDIKIIDFLKGIFNMYKLVVIPLGEDNYYINTLEGYYRQGGLYDITKYVDFNKYDVNRGTIFNEISFKFKEPNTISNILFNRLNDKYFGDEELIIREDPSDPNSEQIDGTTFKLELPFEQVLFERLIDVSDKETTNIVYGRITDENGDATDTEPLVHYVGNSAIGLSSKVIGFVNEFGVSSIINRYNVPIHANTLENPDYSTTFSNEQNVFTNIFMDGNLYSNHYKNYIDSVFNIKKREYKYNSFLPVRITTALELNDILKIKDNYYRINKYSYNVLTGETELDLINFFGDLEIGQTTSSLQNINTDFTAKEIKINVDNLFGSTFLKTEVAGAGTDWLTVVTSEDINTKPNVLELVLASNSISNSSRVMFLDIIGEKNTDRITIRQTGKSLTVDNNTVTVDNNIITADNG
tara:strand:+ start:1122 stop:3503 length:2382 start_codon:yes stop_codon:yes gene_type:complete